MYQDTSGSMSSNASMIMAREVFMHWILTMPVNASPAVEAQKVLEKQDSPLENLPKEVQKDLRHMLRQVAENIAAIPKRRRRNRHLAN
ncbi:hypothetical protein [Curvivirga aplysinae]|uniref:hypothetical protein n=1 Tax=Curvivirga aplysinae TaxID=2529852 RepID=UPI0012BC9F88|nr:hypothetical protein [Curvivirga aplysinae]MTI08732.1 hypothetical protein [Curvivirga aplysinae]